MSEPISENEAFAIQDRKLDDIYREYLMQTPSHTAAEAAQKFSALFPVDSREKGIEAGEMGSPEVLLSNMWERLLLMIRRITHNHHGQKRLVELLIALYDLPTDPVTEIWSTKAKLWKDLPLLEHMIQQEFKRFDFQTLSDASEEQERKEWRNLSAFVARLTSTGIHDYRRYGLSALRYALECELKPWDSDQQLQDRFLDCYVPVAAAWIMNAGWVLFLSDITLDEALPDFALLRLGTERPLVKTWLKWNRRFDEISKDKRGCMETRVLAHQAAKHMASIVAELMAAIAEESDSESDSKSEDGSEDEEKGEVEDKARIESEEKSKDESEEEPEEESEEESKDESEDESEDEADKVSEHKAKSEVKDEPKVESEVVSAFESDTDSSTDSGTDSGTDSDGGLEIKSGARA